MHCVRVFKFLKQEHGSIPLQCVRVLSHSQNDKETKTNNKVHMLAYYRAVFSGSDKKKDKQSGLQSSTCVHDRIWFAPMSNAKPLNPAPYTAIPKP